MRRAIPALGLAVLLAGCGKAEPVGPKAGDRVTVWGVVSIWQDLPAMRESKRRRDAGQGLVAHPEHEQYKALDAHYAGMAVKGAVLDVTELGDDWAKVIESRNQWGEAGSLRGYCWKSDLAPPLPPPS